MNDAVPEAWHPMRLLPDQPTATDALGAALDAVRAGEVAAAERLLGDALGTPPEGLLQDASRLAAIAEERLVEMDWPAAHLLHEILAARGHARFDWLRTRLAWRAAHLEEFRATFEATEPAERLAELLGERIGRKVAAIRSRRMRPGFIGLALIRHDLDFADGGPPLSLVEKVMSSEKRDQRRVNHEHLLFGNMPAERLLAPAYFGAHRQGSFISTFAAFFGGKPLPLERWAATQAELMQHYWAVEPAKKVLRGPNVAQNYRDRLRAIIAGELGEAVTSRLRDVTAEDASHALARRFTAISDTIEAMPLFVLHDDLHCGNILVDDAGGMTIIDWDNWALAPLGSGWRFYMTDDEVPALDSARLRAARRLPPGITDRDLMLMAALWGHHKAMRDGKHELAARWVEKIVRFG